MGEYRVAVDAGGTFTDIVVFDEKGGNISAQKTPSIPRDPAQAVLDALDKVEINMPDMKFFSHGTTVGTNALITRRLPLTGMVTTIGFRDVVEIRRSTKPDLWDHFKDVPPPYIPRRHRLEVEERISYAGGVLTPLNEQQAYEIARVLKKRGIESVAVCFINSHVNGVNERRMKEILQEVLPNTYICTSSELLPEIFEHERFSTCVTNAVLGPVVGGYLNRLTERLKAANYNGEVFVFHSGGGVMKSETATQFSSRLASSGIAAGAIAMNHTARLCGFQNALGIDMGGTSCDISLSYNGDLRMTKEWEIEYGSPIIFPSIEVLTIGAGGGSIASVDEGGSIRNGPESAGADPGPACYQKGGEAPTNTDANLILGRLGTELLDGQIELSKSAAEKSVEKIAKTFDMTVVEAANSIIKLANNNMCDALRLISIRRGYDPREFALVAFGGAGPLHAADLARELEIPVVIVPRYPGVHAALGCLLVDIRFDLSRTYLVSSNEANFMDIEEIYEELESEARAMLQKEGMSPSQTELIRYMDLRYRGQWRSLAVEAPKPIESLDHVLRVFHDEHEREYSWSNKSEMVEIYGLRLTAIGKVSKPTFVKSEEISNEIPESKGTRQVYFEDIDGFIESAVFNRSDLPAGAVLRGPAIVEQLDTTTVIPIGAEAKVDEFYNIIIKIAV